MIYNILPKLNFVSFSWTIFQDSLKYPKMKKSNHVDETIPPILYPCLLNHFEEPLETFSPIKFNQKI